jgi:hypothetical protein
MCLKSKKATLVEPIAQLNSITGGDNENQDGIPNEKTPQQS